MDARPEGCRFRLQDEGKSYPRSSCTACGKTITTGLGTSCDKTGNSFAMDRHIEVIERVEKLESVLRALKYEASQIANEQNDIERCNMLARNMRQVAHEALTNI